MLETPTNILRLITTQWGRWDSTYRSPTAPMLNRWATAARVDKTAGMSEMELMAYTGHS
jgi:hypothetical protein